MVIDLKIKLPRRTPTVQFNIVIFSLARRHRTVWNVGKPLKQTV